MKGIKAVVILVLTLELTFYLYGEIPLPHLEEGCTCIFFCDFRNYPPTGNVEISTQACDFSIFYDEKPHLRLLASEKSTFSFRFSLPLSLIHI